MEEKRPLVESEESSATAGYGTDTTATPPSTPSEGTGTLKGGTGPRFPGGNVPGKKERVHHPPSLTKVEEDVETESKEESVRSKFNYGVKSYLHHFYDSHAYKDPNVFEDDDYLLPIRRRRICNSIWWKVFVWIGANCLVFGLIGVAVGYLVPPRPIIIETSENLDLKDNEAIMYNFNLDVCKLVGLVLFCFGGLTLTLALLFPILLHQYCDDERMEKPFHVALDTTDVPGSPMESKIPVTSQLANVQPGRSGGEAIITKEGMIPYKE